MVGLSTSDRRRKRTEDRYRALAGVVDQVVLPSSSGSEKVGMEKWNVDSRKYIYSKCLLNTIIQ